MQIGIWVWNMFNIVVSCIEFTPSMQCQCRHDPNAVPQQTMPVVGEHFEKKGINEKHRDESTLSDSNPQHKHYLQRRHDAKLQRVMYNSTDSQLEIGRGKH